MKNLKTSEVLAIYSVVKSAKVTKVESSADKFAIIKAIRPLKKIAETFEAWRNDAIASLKPENYEAMEQKAQEWQQQEREGNVTLTEQERIEINQFFYKFNSEVEGCMKEELEKENEIEVSAIGEKSIEQFCDSNDWSVEQMMAVTDFFE